MSLSHRQICVSQVREHLVRVEGALSDGGPPVEWEKLFLLIEGKLDGDEKAEVRKRVETWRSWYNARLELLAVMSNPGEIAEDE